MGTFRDGEKQQDRETGRALRCSMTCLRDDAEWAMGGGRGQEHGGGVELEQVGNAAG